MVWLKGFALLVALLAIAAAGLSAWGARRWAASTQALTARLEAGRLPAVAAIPARYDPREMAGLPAPVRRFFEASVTPGQAMVSAATVEHTGTFNMAATGAPQWKAFTSRQRVVTRQPGFLWNAEIAMAPGLVVRVHDAYVQGQGLLHAAVMGLFRVANVEGDGEIARGELMRFFAEAAWYPTALLPSQGVRWEAVDANTAKANLSDGPLALTLLFGFDDDGLMTSVRAEARGRMVGKAMEMAAWEGRWSNHQRRNGMTVPLTGEVAWLLPEGRQPYWRGTVNTLAYEWAD
jgi:hypothetical protein